VKNLFSFLLVTLLIVTSTTNCARKGSPTGGPKDSISPVMVTANPEYKAIHFDAKKITLSFDEYIKFKDLNKQLIVSPPLKHASIITPVGTASKVITIKIIDTLKENTTYSFNFGNSIVDNNEGNKLGSFKYVFSTGSYVDSLETRGNIVNAFEMETEDNISVLLYEIDEAYTDSIVYKEKPIYVTNTLDTINFDITNIKAGTYQMIALKDFNNNYIYNPKQDKIGFIKEHITIPSDSSYTISLFKEIPKFKLIRPLENKKGKIIFGFEGILKAIDIKLLTETPSDYRSFLNREKEKDTLNYWFTPFETDSLQFHVTGKDIDTLYTVKLRTSKQDSLLLKMPVTGTLHPKDTFSIETNIPIDSLDFSKITIFDKDTLEVPFKTILNTSKNKLSIDFKRKRNENYLISILPKTLVDFYGETNDTLQYKLKTLDVEDYGSIEIGLKSVKKFPILIDLVTDKGTLVERQFSADKTNFVFENLVPASYFLRIILDENDNNIWDTGNFLEKRQAEKVYYYGTELKLKANWTVNEIFDLSVPQIPIQKGKTKKFKKKRN